MKALRFFALPFAIFSLAIGSMALPVSVAAQQPTFHLVLKGNRFEPSTLEVPAGKRIVLVIKNEDLTAEEFESHDLRVEKIIPGGVQATIRVGPLAPGSYKFVGEYHEKTAHGVLIAK